MKLSPFLERRARALQIIAEAERPVASHVVPNVRVKGTTNGSQGVTLGGRRARRGAQRGLHGIGRTAGYLLKLKALFDRHGALIVKITRVAPNRLDGDNLEASLKRVRDGIAKFIGIDDRDPAVEYVADDERGAVREYGVRFEVFPQVRGPSVVTRTDEQPVLTTFNPRTPTPNVKKSQTKLGLQLDRMRDES